MLQRKSSSSESQFSTHVLELRKTIDTMEGKVTIIYENFHPTIHSNTTTTNTTTYTLSQGSNNNINNNCNNLSIINNSNTHLTVKELKLWRSHASLLVTIFF